MISDVIILLLIKGSYEHSATPATSGGLLTLGGPRKSFLKISSVSCQNQSTIFNLSSNVLQMTLKNYRPTFLSLIFFFLNAIVWNKKA